MHRVALLLAFLGGVGLSLQAYVNGQLSDSVGSALLAGCVNNTVGLAALLAVALLSGAMGRAVRALRAGARRRLRAWHLLVGANGALFIVVSASAATQVGIALLTVALVCGQMAGGLAIDRLGLTPAGRRDLTGARLLAVALTVLAVVLAALGTRGDPRLGLLALAVLAGAGITLQQAAVAHVTQVTGEPVVAGAVNFTAGGLVVVVVTLVVLGGPGSWSLAAPPAQWAGGLIGATVTVLLARVVGVLGVLRVMVAVVAGQSVGGLVIDLAAPVPDEAVRLGTVAGVALTIAAVAVSGRATLRRPPAAA